VEILKEEAIYGCGMLSPFFEKAIDRNVLRERMLEIINDLNKCNCVDMDDATKALKEQFVEVEVYEHLKRQLREKEEEIRRLKERLNSQEARQEFPPHSGGFFSANRS